MTLHKHISVKTTVIIITAVLSAMLSADRLRAEDRIGIAEESAFFDLLDPDRAELAAVRKAVGVKDWDAAKEAWAKHLRERTSPQWLWARRDRETIRKLDDKKPAGPGKYAPQADKVLQREFGWLGVPRTLPRDIAWDDDGYEFEWRNVLNRHGFWIDLGDAWLETGDPKYAEDWVYMLRDWIEDNPVDAGGRPWRSLEAGARANSWLEAMNLFMEAPAFDAGTKYLFTRSMVEHARFLYHNNARFKKGNWQTAEARGLAFLGIMMPEFKEAAAWRERAFGLLGTHMKEGVFPDGAQCELTPGYHSHVITQFLQSLVLAEANGYEIAGLRERHEKMFEFLMHLSKPDRITAAVGDAGTGLDIRGIMALGARLYGRADMRYLGADQIAKDWERLAPPEKLAAFKSLQGKEPAFLSHMMPDAQYGVMRTGWSQADRWLMFDCAPWGGAHSHCDQLQVDIYSGRDLLVDPGQVGYDQSISKSYFKKSCAHNVLLLDEEELPKTNPEVLAWTVMDRVEFASGRMKMEDCTHQRSVLFVKPDYWVVVDHVKGSGLPQVTRLFHLPAIEVANGGHAVSTRFDEGQNLWIGCADPARIEMREGWIARGGTPAKAPVAAFVNRSRLPAALCSVLVPYGSPAEIPTLKRLPSDDPGIVRIRLDFKDGRTDQIAVAAGACDLSIAGHEAVGVALCVRSKGEKTTVDAIQPEPMESK